MSFWYLVTQPDHFRKGQTRASGDVGSMSDLPPKAARVADIPDRQVRATKRHRTALIAQRPTLDEFGTKTPELVVCDRPRFL
jgi:hypothetical protein